MRILLLHSVTLSAGGVPLLYLGDEVGTLNHHGYLNDPDKAGDSRWVHRAPRDSARYDKRHEKNSTAGQIFEGLCRLIAVRASHGAFFGGWLSGFKAGNASVLGYTRHGEGARILVLANFSEFRQHSAPAVFSAVPPHTVDLISGRR